MSCRATRSQRPAQEGRERLPATVSGAAHTAKAPPGWKKGDKARLGIRAMVGEVLRVRSSRTATAAQVTVRWPDGREETLPADKLRRGPSHCHNGLQCIAPASCICICPGCRP